VRFVQSDNVILRLFEFRSLFLVCVDSLLTFRISHIAHCYKYIVSPVIQYGYQLHHLRNFVPHFQAALLHNIDALPNHKNGYEKHCHNQSESQKQLSPDFAIFPHIDHLLININMKIGKRELAC